MNNNVKEYNRVAILHENYKSLEELAGAQDMSVFALTNSIIRNFLATLGKAHSEPRKTAYEGQITADNLQRLKPRERAIIKLRLWKWPLDDEERGTFPVGKWGEEERIRSRPWSLAEVSSLYGISRARVAQIEQAAVAKALKKQEPAEEE